MKEPLLLFTWLWRQEPVMHDYDASKVNLWASQLRRHLTIPYRLGCVTDMPDGLDADIEVIPLPKEFSDVRVAAWDEKKKCPQCYRRLTLFALDAERRFGAKRFVSMDMDVLATGKLDSLFDHDHDFVILKGTATHRPYNGGMVQLTAGARPQVFETFTPEGAALSRQRFVGSDQAWISHVLGKGEKTWGPQEGVYYKRLLPSDTWRPPNNMRMLFFPGSPKPWDIKDHVPWVKAAIEGRPFKTTAASIYAYDDPKHWGKWILVSAKKKGMSCKLFTGNIPTGSPTFVRLDQQGPQRAVSKLIARRVHEAGCTMLPTYQESLWYDDKIAQYDVLKRWMPQTWIVKSAAEARALAEKIEFPIISKASEGAGSANVRVLQDQPAALTEIAAAFGAGIKQKFGRQQGYVYWQRIVPENPCDYRICIVGDYLYGLKRMNRPGTLFASGSGDASPLKMDCDRQKRAAQLAVEITRAINTQWMAYDIVFDGDQPLVLEMSSAWTMDAYKDCRMFTHDLEPTQRTGKESFAVAVEILAAMSEQKAAA